MTAPARVDAAAWRALTIGAAGFVLFGFNSTATNLAFASIADSFPGTSESTVSWIASGFFVCAAAFLPLGGRLADRHGRRRIFQLGILGFALTGTLSAIAPSIWILIAARAAQAASAALVIPSSLAMVLPDFPPSRQGSAVATWAAAGPISAAIAPSAAAALLDLTSWRWVYFVSVPVALVIFALSFRYVRESSPETDSESRLDLVGTALAVAAIGLIVIGVSKGTEWGWASARTIGVLVVGLGLVPLFVRRSLSHPTPLLELRLFRDPNVATANVANFFLSMTSLSIWLMWPLWLARLWNYGPSRVGLAITIGPLFAGPATIIGGRLVDRVGRWGLMLGGCFLATAAILWGLLMLDDTPHYLIGFAPMLAGFGMGWGLAQPTMNGWALASVDSAYLGEVNAGFNTGRNLGGALGTAGVITILGTQRGGDALAAYQRSLVFFAFWVAAAFLVLAVGYRREALGRRNPQEIGRLGRMIR